MSDSGPFRVGYPATRKSVDIDDIGDNPTEGSTDVFTENMGQVRVEDKWSCPGESTTGSDTVITNNKESVRPTDDISSGHKVATGSSIILMGGCTHNSGSPPGLSASGPYGIAPGGVS